MKSSFKYISQLMYPQISFPDLKYQLKLFDVVVDIVDIDVKVDVDV